MFGVRLQTQTICKMKEKCSESKLKMWTIANRIEWKKRKKFNERMDGDKKRPNWLCGIWVAIKLSFDRVTFARKFERTLKKRQIQESFTMIKLVLKTKAKHSRWSCKNCGRSLQCLWLCWRAMWLDTGWLGLVSCIAITCQVVANTRSEDKLNYSHNTREQVIASQIRIGQNSVGRLHDKVVCVRCLIYLWPQNHMQSTLTVQIAVEHFLS